ncbi:hypothetical protein QQ045_017722 [Rhodiola kirilowii]
MQGPLFYEEAQLIDVREPDEVSKASLPRFQVFPLRQFGTWGPDITPKLDPSKDTYVLSKKLMPYIGEMMSMQVIVEGSMNSSNPYFTSSWRHNFTGGFILDMGVHFVAGLRMLVGTRAEQGVTCGVDKFFNGDLIK